MAATRPAAAPRLRMIQGTHDGTIAEEPNNTVSRTQQSNKNNDSFGLPPRIWMLHEGTSPHTLQCRQRACGTVIGQQKDNSKENKMFRDNPVHPLITQGSWFGEMPEQLPMSYSHVSSARTYPGRQFVHLFDLLPIEE